MANPLLAIDELSLGFVTSKKPPVLAIDKINLRLDGGKTLAIVGESGSGKTLTALSILRLLPDNLRFTEASRILFNNQELSSLAEIDLRKIRGRGIGVIFQEPMSALNPVMTIGKQIAEVLKTHFKLSRKTTKQRVLELLNDVGIPSPEARLGQYPHELSGGLKQRVMIAMALAGNPEILIADEPTTALDATLQAQILSLLKDLQRKRNLAVLLITHDLAIVKHIADEVAIFYAGQVIEQTTTEAFFKTPRHPYSRALLAAIPSSINRGQDLISIPGQVPTLREFDNLCRFRQRCSYCQTICLTEPPLVQAADAHFSRCHFILPIVENNKQTKAFQEKIIKPSEPILLKLKNLHLNFGPFKALKGIDLTLHKKETLALIGESGSGKTSLGKALLHLYKTTMDEYFFQDISFKTLNRKNRQFLYQNVQMIFQDPVSSMNPRMRVHDIIAEGLYHLKKIHDEKTITQRVESLLTQVGLPPSARHAYPHEFSGGQRQRICIARAIAVEPQLIICDEPTSALDVSVQAQILNLLKRIQKETGISYLLITHNLSVVDYLADRVAVMQAGSIIEEGPTDQILNTPQHPYTKYLMQSEYRAI